MAILAIDVGTSSVKAALLDVSTASPIGEIARVEYALEHPTPDAAEIDPTQVWTAFTQASREAMQGTDQIDGIGLSCLTPALVLLDADQPDNAQPLTPIWTHLDRRPRPVARETWQHVGEEFLRTVGNRPLPGGLSVTCYRQQANDDPSLGSRIRHYLHLNGWLAFRMTGTPAFDPANASFSGLCNTVTDRKWSSRWCDFFGVKQEWLPEIRCGTATIGTLREKVAEEMGAPAGTPVKLGTADTSSAMLAAEMKPGELMHNVGTTQVLATLTIHPQPDPKRLVRQLGVGDEYLHVTHNPVGGVALDWIHQLCFRDQTEDEFFEHSILQALERSTPVRLDPPFLGGDRLEIEPATAAFRQLSLAMERLDLLTALLQEMRNQHYTAVDGLGKGDVFLRVLLTGGGAEVVQRLIPEYKSTRVERIEEGALRGVAKLFTKSN